jgi:hypothetical protein
MGSAQNMADIVVCCSRAIVAGCPTVTLSSKKFPKGFPRGELLSVNPTTGVRNTAFDPVKVLAWVHKTNMAGWSASTVSHGESVERPRT